MRLYSWTPDNKASKIAIQHFINEAIERKKWAETITPEWLGKASTMSRESVHELRNKSVHSIARKSLEYCRMRSKLRVYGNYPSDMHAYNLWNSFCVNCQQEPESDA